jgi:TrmH family RNA methyltransferase
MTITSPHNDQLKEIRKLAGRRWRDKLKAFVAEGEDLLAAADAAGWSAELRLVAEGSGLAGEEVRPELLAAVSQLGSGTRALAVYGQRWAPAPVGPLCVALWGVNDPGNVGTVLRAGLAFRAGSVALGPGTADPYGPKAVRAAMGARLAVAGALRGRAAGADGRAGGTRRGTAARGGGGRAHHDRRRRRARRSPAGRRRRLRRRRDDPDRRRVAERRDGRDHRPVRVQP